MSQATHSIAIAHDQFRVRGGAERVAFRLARLFDAPIYAARVDDGIVPDDITVHDITDSRLGYYAMKKGPLFQDAYQMIRWQQVWELQDYDIVVQTKTNPWWYIPPETQTVVRYVHSTPRGLYDLYHRRSKRGLKRVIDTYMRDLFAQTIPYASAWACNSDVVAKRLEHYLGIPAEAIETVYPPVDVDSYGPGDADADGDSYLTFSRLEGHKRTDEIIEAFEAVPECRLVVGGDGSARDQLEEQAGDNVEFIGWMSESEKRRRLAEAKALVFAAENEDFGMVPVEALASGTPVIGVNEGFTRHQVLPERTGIRFERGELPTAIRTFETDGVRWSADEIARWADRFAVTNFDDAMERIVHETYDADRIDPWGEPTPAIVADGGSE